MKFTKIVIHTPDMPESELDLLTSRLTDLGAEGFEFGGSNFAGLIPAPTFGLEIELDPVTEIPPPTVTVYIPDNEQGAGVVRMIRRFLDTRAAGKLEHYIEGVAEEDWENNWKEHFHAFTVGEKLLIKPSWEECDNTEGRLVLQIDPASAFGTGQHASTRMCLELLEKYCGDHAIDIGCGSGILTAAACLLGAHYVAAIDVCENAVRVTEETVKLNGFTENVELFCGNLITDQALCEAFICPVPSNVLVANLTADVITAMVHIFAKFKMYPKHAFIFSGIIEQRLPEVTAALEPHFAVAETRRSEGWVALVCSKK
jgi:ribosomal protein L11 methyltransferase